MIAAIRQHWPRIALGRPLQTLPWLIGGTALVLVLKLSTLLQTPGTPAILSTAGRAVVPTAQAAEHEAPQAEPKVAEPPRPPAKPPSPVAATISPPPPDPGPSDAERALLTDLRARRLALDDRARALDAREALSAAAERRLTDRVEQLTALQTRLEGLDKAQKAREDANWRSLVKTYETMRPRDAATIFNDLDQPVLIQVLDRMKEAKAAPVLAAMLPERARFATAELMKWRNRASGGQP